MSNKIEPDYEVLSEDELRAELRRLKENLCDLEETHHFTFSKTTVHIGRVRSVPARDQANNGPKSDVFP